MLVEWHIPPENIIENWTDEKFALMLEKLMERKEREKALMRGEEPPTHKISDSQFFAKAGIEVKKNVD